MQAAYHRSTLPQIMNSCKVHTTRTRASCHVPCIRELGYDIQSQTCSLCDVTAHTLCNSLSLNPRVPHTHPEHVSLITLLGCEFEDYEIFNCRNSFAAKKSLMWLCAHPVNHWLNLDCKWQLCRCCSALLCVRTTVLTVRTTIRTTVRTVVLKSCANHPLPDCIDGTA